MSENCANFFAKLYTFVFFKKKRVFKMRKVKINDNQGQSVEVDIDKFKKHLDEYHINHIS